MKRLTVTFIFILTTIMFSLSAAFENSDRQAFEKFIQRHNKEYTNLEQKERRFSIFKKNLEKIKAMNRMYPDVYGITPYADMETEEFSLLMGFGPITQITADKNGSFDLDPNERTSKRVVPDTLDWRDAIPSVVTPVYHQGTCSCCWAFAAVESLESRLVLAGESLVPLSVQQLVDCNPYDAGCMGGTMDGAFRYMLDSGGIQTASDYPYVSGNGVGGSCDFDSSKVNATIQGYTNRGFPGSPITESEMKTEVALNGPIAVAVDATIWMFYTGPGVLMGSHCQKHLNHAVVLVGYNTTANPPYWIARNTWGTSWGIDGYIKIQYGVDACGVSKTVTYPNV